MRTPTRFTLTLFLALSAHLIAATPTSAQDDFGKQELPAQGLSSQDHNGRAVAVAGNFAAVGRDDQVQFYHWNGSSWTLEQVVSSSDAGFRQDDSFGGSVAISGSCSIVGARSGGLHGYGEAYVLCRTGSGDAPWQLSATLNAPDGRQDARFGFSVDIDGDYAVVGALRGGASNDMYIHAGSAYVYYRDQGGADNWGLQKKLNASDEAGLHEFGHDVALDGTTLLVGAPENESGAAYVFERDFGGANNWAERQKIDPKPVAHSGAEFGRAVALDGDFAVIAAPGEHAPQDDSGEIYAFTRSGSTWSEADRVAGSDTENLDEFGNAVAIDGPYVLVGSAQWDGPGGAEYYDRGKAYAFAWNGSTFSELATLMGNNNGFAWFGSDVAMSGGKAIVGARGDNARGAEAGAAFAFVLVPGTPANFQASDGSSIQNISLTWEKSVGAEGYRIYRDEGTSPIEEPAGLSFADPRSPGEVHAYEIIAYNSIAESSPASDVGRTRANGEIRGSVSSNLGNGVPDVRIHVEPYQNEAAAFDGVDDYIEIDHSDALNVSDAFIIEAWIKPEEVTGRQAVFSTRIENSPGAFQLEIGSAGVPGGYGRVAVTTINTYVYRTDDDVIPAGEWSHVRFVRFTNGADNFSLLYVNGEYVAASTSTSSTFLDNDRPKLIGAGLNLNHFFHGEIDEVRLWDHDEIDVNLADFVDSYLYERLGGSEPGLAGYWRLDPEIGSIVADHSEGSHGRLRNGAAFTGTEPAPITLSTLTDVDGAYELRNIDYNEGSTFTVTPELEGHGFDPSSRDDVFLSDEAPSKSGINFTDTTAIVVSGQITFEIGGCPHPGVDILLNGVESATTDHEGRFTVTVINPGPVEITPSHGEHAFEPASVVYDGLTASVEGVEFVNVETRSLDGRVVGGDCGLPLGEVSVALFGAGGCSFTREADADADGNYLITNLPALDTVTVEATVEDDPLITFAPRQVPLAAGDTTANFIYRAPPQISLTDWPDPVGSCGITVMEQLETYGFYVNVVEEYGGQTCPSTRGHVVFRNEIADSESSDTLALTSEPVYYEFQAGEPNITAGGARPFQKRLGIEVVTGGGPQAGPNGYSESVDQWAIVEGNRPREKTFATVTPEIPLLILRDPPGDQSYSYASQGSTMCTNMGFSALTDDGSDTWGNVKLGNAFSISGGVGISYGTDFAFWGEIGTSIETGSVTLNQTATQVCHTTTETFSTSDSELVTGNSGDVFIGGAMNFLYALTDVVEYDPATCQVKISQDVIFAPDKFATTYIYTEDYIAGNLVPRLEGLAANPSTPADSVQFLQDQIEVWEQAIKRNEALKENATFVENRSFSSGTAFESSTTGESTTSTSYEFNTYVDEELAVEAGLEIAGSGASGGHRMRLRTELGTITDTSLTETNTVGFMLADDDPGDYFSVDILNDETYGTPVFQTVSGESSCLWEEGTRPRDAIQLQADAFVRSDVDPDEAASFQVTLSNPSQTETDENRQYYVAPLQESNPDGAALRLNGDAFSDGIRLTVPTRGSVTAVLTVERGPEAFSYEDVQIMAYPECEYAAWQNGAPLQIADTMAVSVHFETACSPVTMSLPEDGWIVNGTSGDVMQVLASDFDPAALTNLKLQVSPAGRNDWSTVALLPQSDLSEKEVVIEWDVSEMPDGAYKLRLASTCSEGTSYSDVSAGTIDRAAPVVAGTPAPADGIYHQEDAIAVSFNEALDCAGFGEPDAVLTVKETGDKIETVVVCEDRRIEMVPDAAATAFENKSVQATILRAADAAGNAIAEPVTWTFRLNTNPVRWESALLSENLVEGDSPLLSATLANSGDAEESFALAQVPTWLTPDVTSGALPSESSRAIVFTLEGGLTRGTYRDTVIAQTDRGDEPLFVEVTVQCPGPGWTFTEDDAAPFAGSMHLVSGFYIDQIPFLNENDLVAAFVDEELRGLAEAVRLVPQDEYAAFLNVYGDADGATVRFRVWDASECVQRQVAGTRTFESGAVHGSVNGPDSLDVSGAVLQTVALNDGWTWMSLGVESSDMAVETVLERVRPVDGNVIRGQSAFAQYVAGEGWIGPLSALDPGVMYQILVDTAQALEFVGEPIVPDDRPLAVEAGWNWLGYLPDASLPPATALASFPFAEGDLLLSQTQSAEFAAAGWQGPLTTMHPGEGYLMHLHKGGTITYPGAAGEIQESAAGVIAFAGKQGGPDWSVDSRAFEKVMNVTGTVQVDGLPLTGADHMIGAFVDGEVRGLAKPVFAMDTWLYFLTIYGDSDGEEVTFKIYNASRGEATDLAEVLPFQSTQAHGTPRKPVVFDVGSAVGSSAERMGELPDRYELSPNYPNPFNPTTQIRYAVKEQTKVELTVFNLLGREVMRLVDDRQAPGWYTVTFEGAGLASGVYLYHLKAGDFTKTQKMTLVK